jgi:hypothetical protein
MASHQFNQLSWRLSKHVTSARYDRYGRRFLRDQGAWGSWDRHDDQPAAKAAAPGQKDRSGYWRSYTEPTTIWLGLSAHAKTKGRRDGGAAARHRLGLGAEGR